MIVYENQCVSCGKPCKGNACGYRRVPVLVCDRCNDAADELRDYDGEQVCELCAAMDPDFWGREGQKVEVGDGWN